MNFIRRIIVNLLLFSCAVAFILGSLLGLLILYGEKAGKLEQETIVIIEKGLPTYEIALKLEENGIIKHPLYFTLLTKIFKTGDSLKAGEYEFPAQVSANQVIEILKSGKVVVHKFIVPEGLTNKEIIEKINQEPLLMGEVANIYDEGTLLPETYFFTYGDKKIAILEKMISNMEQTINELWETRSSDLPFSTKKEAMILASIVERETGHADERKKVAAVFINRLKIGMRLQADPTVIYAVSQGYSSLNRAVTVSDLKIDSPYNTYINKGFPPTPIANPGRKAIEAVLNPAITKDLYFVADGQGSHNFSTNLEGHNDNVKTYKEFKKSTQ